LENNIQQLVDRLNKPALLDSVCTEKS
jgi:hypothetical protein